MPATGTRTSSSPISGSTSSYSADATASGGHDGHGSGRVRGADGRRPSRSSRCPVAAIVAVVPVAAIVAVVPVAAVVAVVPVAVAIAVVPVVAIATVVAIRHRSGRSGRCDCRWSLPVAAVVAVVPVATVVAVVPVAAVVAVRRPDRHRSRAAGAASRSAGRSSGFGSRRGAAVSPGLLATARCAGAWPRCRLASGPWRSLIAADEVCLAACRSHRRYPVARASCLSSGRSIDGRPPPRSSGRHGGFLSQDSFGWALTFE